MLRYDRQTKPGLDALYDIRPGNGVGLFLQTRSPNGVASTDNLTRTTKRQNTYMCNKRYTSALIHSNTLK